MSPPPLLLCTAVASHSFTFYRYSANDFRNPDYAVGYAVADNPYGPWKKYEGKLIHRVSGICNIQSGRHAQRQPGLYYLKNDRRIAF